MMTSTEGVQLHLTTNIAHLGIVGKASVFSISSMNNTWIIDTSATDHVTRDPGQLKSVFHSPQTVILTTNGSTCPIT